MRVSIPLFLLFVIFFSIDANASSRLFGKTEERNRDIGEFPKWTGVIEKKDDEFDDYGSSCADKDSKLFYCNIKDWITFLDGLKEKPKLEQIKEVHKFANKHKYILDINNWGETDYWESPGEFLLKNGDCEDYAIIKYFSLRYLGFDADDIRVVVLFDNNLGIYHSVLAAYYEDDIYILDNQLSNITKDKNILHYNPVYSINEDHWWRHL
jgi:predicted transglutaminase-like cysteine proteinase